MDCVGNADSTSGKDGQDLLGQPDFKGLAGARRSRAVGHSWSEAASSSRPVFVPEHRKRLVG